MTELKDLENRLKRISNTDWNKLFRLITEIEESSSFEEMKEGFLGCEVVRVNDNQLFHNHRYQICFNC